MSEGSPPLLALSTGAISAELSSETSVSHSWTLHGHWVSPQFTLSLLSVGHVKPYRAKTCLFSSLWGYSTWYRWGLFRISSVTPRCCFSTCGLTFWCIFPPAAMFFLILPCYNLPCFLSPSVTHTYPSPCFYILTVWKDMSHTTHLPLLLVTGWRNISMWKSWEHGTV